MDEYIDIVTQDGKPTGKIALKSNAHKNGWYHNTVHLWLYTKNGEILLQQRSHKKKIHPLLWDVSVAGHIDAGESFTDAVIRETKEEIGLEILKEDLLKIGTFLHETKYDTTEDNEFHHVFIAQLKQPISNLNPSQEEVEALKLVSFSEFEHLLNKSDTNKHFISTNKEYYLFVIESIKQKIFI